ncbi:MAG: 3D domain-containing protein [Pseudomonadota bacterium]
MKQVKSSHALLITAAVVGATGLTGCEPAGEPKTMEVTASAYTMREEETKKGNVGLAAWGDQLEPGMKAIAVSRDLIPQGLDHETEVKIEGLSGYYVVRDKMNKRWDEKIDIFMGTDVEAAREWGKKEDLEITWWVPEEE